MANGPFSQTETAPRFSYEIFQCVKQFASLRILKSNLTQEPWSAKTARLDLTIAQLFQDEIGQWKFVLLGEPPERLG